MGLKDLKHAPRRTTLRLLLDDNVRAEFESARADLAAYEKNPESLDSKPQQRFDDAQAAAEDAAVTFVFEALSRIRLAELIADCPPTSEQLEQWKEEDRNNPLLIIDPPAFDYENFAPRLIAASLVEPETTVDEVMELWESGDWSEAIWLTLWDAAWKRTNQVAPTLPTFGTDTRKT
jgi:hypothetical protein